MENTAVLNEQMELGRSEAKNNHRLHLKRSSSSLSLVDWMRLDSSFGMEDIDFHSMKRANSQVGKSNVVSGVPTSADAHGLESAHNSKGSVKSDKITMVSTHGSWSTRASPHSKRRVVTKSEETQICDPHREESDSDSCVDAVVAGGVSDADIPDPSSSKCSPDEYLLLLTKAQLGIDLEAKQASSLIAFFVEVTEEQMAAYNSDVVGAVRNNDLDLLKKLHEEGQSLDCSNRFGESLLNMACRRGFEAMVQYLMENDVNIRLCDDTGRTPLHDACWNPTPQIKICQSLIEKEPSLLLVADRRGCTAFQYARMEHWDQWRTFLFENRECLLKLKHPDIMAKFAKNQDLN